MALVDWSTAALAQIAGSTVRPAVFLHVESTPPMLLWGGVGDFPVPADNILSEPTVATGMGELNDIPEVQQLLNGTAERLEFRLSGVPVSAYNKASNEASTVRGAECQLGLMVLGGPEDTVGRWQPLSPIFWFWFGQCDVIKGGATKDGNNNFVRNIRLSVGSIFTARRRAAMSYFTDSDQRRRSPDDAFCERVAMMSSTVTKRFKPRS